MSETTTATTELTSQYAAQVTSDLERNSKEQERIGTEIAALQEQLAALQHDHSVLVNVRQALGISEAPLQPAATPDSTTVPAPRKKTASEPDASKRTRAKKAEPTQNKPTAKKSTAKETTAKESTAKESTAKESTAKESTAKQPAAKGAAAKAAQPTLVELVRTHLTEQNEPRSAAEVSTALGTAHPERGIKTTVVRTTLEGLVAKNQARRAKQGSSVFYTAPSAAEQTTAASQDEAQSEQVE